MIVTGPLLLAVHPSVPAQTLKEFIALARSRPGDLRYASTGAGTNLHLAGALFEQLAGVRMLHVPYKGQGPAITELLGGEVQLIFSGPGTLMQHVQAGRLRALAVTSEKRVPRFPDLPPVAESLPGFISSFWTAVIAPRGTPRAIVARLNDEIAPFLEQPELRRLQADGIFPAHSTPEGLATIIRDEVRLWTRVVKEAGIQAGG
jgi:tripartite-type tricarboxylate transporter receptor subunit TctC